MRPEGSDLCLISWWRVAYSIPKVAAPATYLKQILPSLQKLNWDVRVITYGDSSRTDCPYPVTRIPRQAYPLRLARYALAARSWLRWADLTYLHSIDLPLWGGAGGPRVMKVVGDQAWERCARKGWIQPEVGIDAFQGVIGGRRVRWQKASRSRQIAAMNAVIVPSQYLASIVLGWGVPSEKIHVIYNALSRTPMPAASRPQIRAELGWDDRPTLLTAARLQPWKGVDHLLAALTHLPEIRLLVAGDGPDLSRLRSLAAPLGKRVEFVGDLDRAQLARLMVAADGVALYSAYEGLSHTLLESLRLGTPVLASDLGGNPEVVTDGVNGLLIQHVDITALRAGIVTLLDRRAELAAGTKLGLERFRFERMLAETDALLKSLL